MNEQPEALPEHLFATLPSQHDLSPQQIALLRSLQYQLITALSGTEDFRDLVWLRARGFARPVRGEALGSFVATMRVVYEITEVGRRKLHELGLEEAV